MTVIDAHHHFWRRGESQQPWRRAEHAVLDRSFGPTDLRPHLTAAGVDRTVLIQSVNTLAENERLLDYAASVDFVAGVVAWLPVDEPAIAEPMLANLADKRAVRGVRFLIASDDIDWLTKRDSLNVLSQLAELGLCWDVVPVTSAQIRAILAVAEAVPNLRIVIDHLGRPPLECNGWQPWSGHMRDLAQVPGIAVKVSIGLDVLTAWRAWSATVLHRYVDHICDAFGASRLMLASNWPVIELRSPYGTAWHDLDFAVDSAGMTRADLTEVRGGTAARWYQLPLADAEYSA